MRKMGKYCKAYPIERFREYGGWSEKAFTDNGKEAGDSSNSPERSFLYLQENYVVTSNIFLDEDIVFDDVTPEWIDHCTNALKFEVPVYESVSPQAQSAIGPAEDIQ